MRQSVLELRDFYASPLGGAAQRMVARKVTEAWDGVSGLDLLGLGYASPFLQLIDAGARRSLAAMPPAQGVEAWPVRGANRACLGEEAALPFPNAFFDRILVVHALEESDNPSALLAEATRVLSPSGRIILVVAARRGLWAHVESSPFGHGRSFSRAQLERLVGEADLTPLSWTRALYAPPLRWASRWADAFEQSGAWLWPSFSGLIMLEASKQTLALRPRGLAARVPARRPVFAPAPVSGKAQGPVPVARVGER